MLFDFMKSSVTALCLGMIASPTTCEAEESWTFSDRLDIQARYDARSNKNNRSQYRLRYYPSISMNTSWSLNSFVVTGDDFASSHNTLFDGESQPLHVRRLFVRHTTEWGKTEVGVIPTYKGHVSSTGLSKDGWIGGIRHVYTADADNSFEIVVGQLNNQDPAKALQLADDIDYVEFEYSGRASAQSTFEVSLERMTGGNFFRGEYRYAWRTDNEVFFEVIQRLDKARSKAVVGLSGGAANFGYHVYFSHVDDELGLRAELTEDFLGYGDGFSAEISSDLPWWQNTDWFVRLDVVDDVERLLSGIKVSLRN